MNSLIRSAMCLALALSCQATSFAGFFFNVESATITGDTGSVNVFISSDSPGTDFAPAPLVNSYIANLQATGLVGISSVTFQPATIATAPYTPLFPSTPNTFTQGTSLGVSTALADSGLNPALYQNAGLFKVNFTVPTGQSGVFNLTFTDTLAAPTDLYNSAFSEIPTGFHNGTITVISAVPEPATLGLGGLAMVGAAVLKRRRAKKSKKALAA